MFSISEMRNFVQYNENAHCIYEKIRTYCRNRLILIPSMNSFIHSILIFLCIHSFQFNIYTIGLCTVCTVYTYLIFVVIININMLFTVVSIGFYFN